MQRELVPLNKTRGMRFDLSHIPTTVQTDLCVMAIQCTASAMATEEGSAAIERGRQAYLLHLERKDAGRKSRVNPACIHSAGASGA